MEEPKKPIETPKTHFTPSKTPTPIKRKLNNADLQNSPYFKIRALVRQLRPHFIQVLQTPDFRNCKAAHEIQTQLKPVMDLYKQMTVEKSADKKPLTPPFSSERELDDDQNRQSYVVGGSVFGWNFITFFGSNPVYYGVTKESYRSSHKK